MKLRGYDRDTDIDYFTEFHMTYQLLDSLLDSDEVFVNQDVFERN